MNEEAVTEKLAAALPESLGPVGLRRPAIPELNVPETVTGYGLELLTALLPVVREIAAEELRDAAWDYPDALNPGRAVQGWLWDRADALTEPKS